MEIAWTSAAALVLVFLFVLTARAMQVADPTPVRGSDLSVIGHQWWWEIRYPDGTVTANEIISRRRSDRLVGIGSADVIHSFWVPQLGRKIEAIPGKLNQIWIRADEPGDYQGACSEFCGDQHAWMRILVVAQSPSDYEAWLKHEAVRVPPRTNGDAQKGEALFREKACAACHAVGGALSNRPVGPDLTHFREPEQHRRRRVPQHRRRFGPLAEQPPGNQARKPHAQLWSHAAGGGGTSRLSGNAQMKEG